MPDEVKDEGSQPTDPQGQQGDEAGEETATYMGQELPKRVVEILKEKDAHVTRTEQELAELRKKDEEDDVPAEGWSDDPQERQAQEFRIRQAKKQLGLPEDGSLDDYIEKKLQERENKTQFFTQVKELESRYNGEGEFKDYPKFDPEAVAQYANQHRIGDMEAAYRQMNYGKIIDAEVKKAKAQSATPEGDISDAPQVEPTDEKTISKKMQDWKGDPTDLAKKISDLGLGTMPKN